MRTLRGFVRQLEAGGLVPTYYSGHGVQVNAGGEGAENYLLAVDINGRAAGRVPQQSLPGDSVVRAWTGANAGVWDLIVYATRTGMSGRTTGRESGVCELRIGYRSCGNGEWI